MHNAPLYSCRFRSKHHYNEATVLWCITLSSPVHMRRRFRRTYSLSSNLVIGGFKFTSIITAFLNYFHLPTTTTMQTCDTYQELLPRRFETTVQSQTPLRNTTTYPSRGWSETTPVMARALNRTIAQSTVSSRRSYAIVTHPKGMN